MWYQENSLQKPFLKAFIACKCLPRGLPWIKNWFDQNDGAENHLIVHELVNLKG